MPSETGRLARHGEQRLDPEKFERQFGPLPEHNGAGATYNLIVDTGSVIAIVAVLVTAISVALNFMAGSKGLRHNRAAANRAVVGDLLIEAAGEVREARAVIEAISSELQAALKASRRPLFFPLERDHRMERAVRIVEKMNSRIDQLLIRFGHGEVTATFCRARECFFVAVGVMVLASSETFEGEVDALAARGERSEGDIARVHEAFLEAAFEVAGVRRAPSETAPRSEALSGRQIRVPGRV